MSTGSPVIQFSPSTHQQNSFRASGTFVQLNALEQGKLYMRLNKYTSTVLCSVVDANPMSHLFLGVGIGTRLENLASPNTSRTPQDFVVHCCYRTCMLRELDVSLTPVGKSFASSVYTTLRFFVSPFTGGLP